MKITRKILLKAFFILSLSISFISSLNAGLVDAISVVINSEPITLYEVYKYSQKFKISKKEALDILIRQKLEDAQIKKLNISVDSFEVENYIDKLAKSNGISTFKFLTLLQEKGIDEDVYRKDLRKKIQKDKLYRKIFSQKAIKIDENDLRVFYNKNKQMFVKANKFSVTIYESKDKKLLEKIKNNPMMRFESVVIKNTILSSGKIDPKIEQILDQTRSGEFSPILPIKGIYSMFYIREKQDIKTIPFEKVKNYIHSVIASKKEKEIINDYFEKLRASADIKVLRRP